MKVYRVAHHTAKFDGFPSGPYAYGDSLPDDDVARIDNMRWDHSDADHPSPTRDEQLDYFIADHERCGFDSLDALYTWFHNWTRALHESGFRLWVYEVPDYAVRVGAHGQALFDKYEAEMLSMHKLDLAPTQLALFS